MMTEEERKAKKKATANAYAKAYYEANKVKLKAYYKARNATPEQKAYQKARTARPDRKAQKSARERARSPLRKYGITLQQRDAMIQAQGNRCLCCKTLFGLLRTHRPCIDHCHKTGKVRGILCIRCNTLLGHAYDEPKILRACARYLKQHARSDRDEEASQATG